MAWIEVHQTIWTDDKTFDLCDSLGIDVPAAVGHLLSLWHWCLDHAEDGDLSEFSHSAVARASRWEGDAEAFCVALVECHWLVKGDNGGMSIRNWNRYAGRLIEKRTAAREARSEGGRRSASVRRERYGTAAPLISSEPLHEDEDSLHEENEPTSRTDTNSLHEVPARCSRSADELDHEAPMKPHEVNSNSTVTVTVPKEDIDLCRDDLELMSKLSVILPNVDSQQEQRYLSRIVSKHSSSDLVEEAERCVLFHSKGRRKIKSWSLTFGNWMKNSVKYAAQQRDGPADIATSKYEHIYR